MTTDTNTTGHSAVITTGIAEEFCALADLLEAAGAAVWDEPSLCESWRTREVVAHVTMPVRYPGPAFMAELEAAGGDFTRLSNTVAVRDGGLATERLLADLRSDVLHRWQPPGGSQDGALTHCVVHCLDVIESIPLSRRVPDERIRSVLALVADPSAPNLFGTDLSGVELRADNLEWSLGEGALVEGPAQALVSIACGRLLPSGRLRGEGAPRFTRS
jgi:uncharacterized protein (TIGR03083 family)